MAGKKRVSVRWYINCGCGFFTVSLKAAADHARKTGHRMDGKVVVSGR